MGKTRALGGVLLIVGILVIIAHIYFGYISGGEGSWARGALAFALPVTVGLIVVCGLMIWLGWIMATTKEVTPPSTAKKEEKPAEAPKK
ncbi:MAG: hypothetical protein QW179_04230 [Candidatus Hadarchaeales archaeon]